VTLSRIVLAGLVASAAVLPACKNRQSAPPDGAAADEVPMLYPSLQTHVDTFLEGGQPETIDQDRLFGFEPLADWIAEQQRKGRPAHLLFVCTHNSRRSQMAQAWAQAAALRLGLDQVATWSGGTEATAFNPRAVHALRGHGFRLEPTGEVAGEGNVVYELAYGPDLNDRAFSKIYSDPFNPAEGFAAVMVCSSADASCPYVEGADLRVSVPYLDPKASDGTPEEEATYAAKSQEIGREMAWLMAQVEERLRP